MKVIISMLLCLAAVSASIVDEEQIQITPAEQSDIEQLQKLSEDLTQAKKAIEDELREALRSSSPRPDSDKDQREEREEREQREQRQKSVHDRKCDVFSCIDKLTKFNATAERIDTESILASISAGRLDAPSKIVVAACRKFNDFNKCLGGDWLECFDTKTVVDVINKIFKAMPIPAVQDMTISPLQLEELSTFVIEFCHRVEEIPKIEFQQCQLDSIVANERLVADYRYLAQFDFDACPSVSCDLARRLTNLLTHSSQVACGDDAATLTFALSRAAANAFVHPSELEQKLRQRVVRPSPSSRRISRDTCDITESELSTMKEFIRSIKRDQDDLLSIVRRRDDERDDERKSSKKCRRDVDSSEEKDSRKKHSKKDRKDSSEEEISRRHRRRSDKKSDKKHSKKSDDESGESSEEERRRLTKKQDKKSKKDNKRVDRKGRVIVKKSKDESGESSEELRRRQPKDSKKSKKSSKKSVESREDKKSKKEKKDKKSKKDSKKSSKKDSSEEESRKEKRDSDKKDRKDKKDNKRDVEVDDEELLDEVAWGRFTPKYFIAKKSFEKIVVAERKGRRDDKKVDFEQFLRDMSEVNRKSDDREEEEEEERKKSPSCPRTRRSTRAVVTKKVESRRAKRMSPKNKHDLEDVLARLSKKSSSKKYDSDEEIDVSHEKSKYSKKSSKKVSKKSSKKSSKYSKKSDRDESSEEVSKKSSKKHDREEESSEEVVSKKDKKERKVKKDKKDKSSKKNKQDKKSKKEKKDKKHRRYPSKAERESKSSKKY